MLPRVVSICTGVAGLQFQSTLVFAGSIPGFFDAATGEAISFYQSQIGVSLVAVLALSTVLALIVGLAQLRARDRRRTAETAALRDDLVGILETVPNAIIALDAQGRVTCLNQPARQILGGVTADTPFDWPRSVHFLDTECEAPLDASIDPLARLLNGETIRGETHLIRVTGPRATYRVARVDGTGMLESPSENAAVLVLEDITGLENQRQLVDRKSRLDALGRLTSGIAHDFNNLLASLVYAIDMARGATDAARRGDILDLAARSVDRGRELSTRLLAFAKRQPDLASSMLVSDAMDRFAAFVRPMIEAQIKFNVLPVDPDLRIYCDAVQFETALLNLVLNSRDAIMRSGQGSRIQVLVRPAGQMASPRASENFEASGREGFRFVEILVSDNGPGMPADTLAHSVDAFFTTKEGSSGTGLGLPMVHSFAHQSDGDLLVFSEAGVGTTAVLTLPRGTESGKREEPMPLEPPAMGQGETILLVEDQEELLIMMTEMLEELAYTVVPAVSGVEALALASKHQQIDLLLTDVILPGEISGFELARRMRLSSPEIPVIYTSGYSGISSPEPNAVTAPMLQKPAPREELARTISDAFDAYTQSIPA